MQNDRKEGDHTELKEKFSDISDSSSWFEITPIECGLSGENKYHIMKNNGTELILRTADIENYKHYCDSAMFSQYVHEKLGINMNLPIEVAACCGDTLAYTLYTWVDGFDADEKILNQHTPEQAQIGEKAGAMLKKIHSIKAPKNILPWNLYFGKKLDELLGIFRYKVRGSFKGDKETAEYLENNRELLEDRPQTALHGDFRSGNLIMTKNGELGIIDFGSWCWGDPYMDFQCIRRSCSAPFSRGVINGYFEGDIPGDFFALMAFYTAADIIRHICDAHSCGDHDEYIKAVKAAEKAVEEYAGFAGNVPSWY